MNTDTPASPNGPGASSNRRILVVDDDAELLATVTEALTAAGYTVQTASDGSQVRAAVDSGRPDLVITDILMPDKDGIEVVRELRKSNPQLPVITMSGGGLVPPKVYLELAGGLGARAILEKPFSMVQLLAEVEKALSGSQAG